MRRAPLEDAHFSEPHRALVANDAEGWQKLAAEGYTIRPFLDAAEIEALLALRLATIPDVPPGFYVSIFSSAETKRAILKGFQTILNDKLKTLAPGYSMVSAQFVTKKGDSTNGRVELHQDSSLVDQRKDLGINVWAPLCDVNHHNGCLRIAGRSHLFNLIGFLPPLHNAYGHFEKDLVPPCVTSLPMKAGEACLFDSRLLHASEDNHSGADRVAILFNLIPENRPARMYFRNPEAPGKLEVFQVDSEFILHLQPLHYPNAAEKATMTFLGSFDYVQQKLTKADFIRLHPGATQPSRAAAAKAKSATRSLWSRILRRLKAA